MKPSRESQRMYRSRVSYGSVVASVAMICVLSLVPSVVSPAGGFFTLPLAHAQCCSAPDFPVPNTNEAEPLIAWIDPADRALGSVGESGRTRGIIYNTVPEERRASSGIHRQASFFTTRNSYGKTGGWRLQDRAATRVRMSGLKAAELMAGAAQITATWGSGGTTVRLALAPAVSFADRSNQRLESARRTRDNRVTSLALEQENLGVAHDLTNRIAGTEFRSGGAAARRELDAGSDIAVATDTTALDEATASNDDTAGSGTSGETGGESASADDGEFSGSAAPSGPNLSSSEERDIIVNGWK
jgi:hypothetical protein